MPWPCPRSEPARHPPDVAQRPLDVLRSQLAVLAHAVPGLLQRAAQAVKHGGTREQRAAPPLQRWRPEGRRRRRCPLPQLLARIAG